MRKFEAFIVQAIANLKNDPRILGMLRHGSCAYGGADELSDLDLTLVTSLDDKHAVLNGFVEVAATMGDLQLCRSVSLMASGQVFFCLFQPELLRVEISVKALGDLRGYPLPPIVDWDRTEGSISNELTVAQYGWTQIDSNDIEERFWLCLDNGTRRLARGELFEALDCLAVLRRVFIGPMLFRRHGLPPRGLRRIEVMLPGAIEVLAATVGLLNHESIRNCYLEIMRIFCDLRNDNPPDRPRDDLAQVFYKRLFDVRFSDNLVARTGKACDEQ